MKYMGSKRAMLQNGLGKLLVAESEGKTRVVDLFCGGASVAWYAAQKLPIPVHAIDLQNYAVVMARSVIGRAQKVNHSVTWKAWKERAVEIRCEDHAWKYSLSLDTRPPNTATWRKRALQLVEETERPALPIWTAYAGHYFSPSQSLTLDALLKSLPSK